MLIEPNLGARAIQRHLRSQINDLRSGIRRRGASNRRGIAALEFAIVAPLMITLVIGVVDISEALTLQQEVNNAAHAIVTSASSLAVQTDNSTSLTVTQVQQVLSGIFAAMPTLRSGIQSGIHSATLTSIAFQQADPNCVSSATNTCSYLPYAIWSVSYADPPGRYAGNLNTFRSVTRCPLTHAPLNQVLPSQIVAGDLTSLPTKNVTLPPPGLVADVHYRYTPMFMGYFILAPVDFWASSLWPVRSVNPSQNGTTQPAYTQYDIANTAKGAGQCP